MLAPPTSSLIEEGGDWDRRNRLKTYEGLYAMSIRDFKKTATCFFDTMATFTSTELMDYRTFSKYAIICCMLAQDRKDIKDQVCIHTCRGHMHGLGYCVSVCHPDYQWQ